MYPTSKGHLRQLVGAIALLVSVAYVVGATDYSIGNLAQPGAAVFPITVGIVLAIVSVYTIVDGYRMRLQSVSEPLRAGNRGRVLKFGALIGSYVIALWLLGSLVSSFLLAAGVMRLLSDKKWFYIAICAFILSATMHLIFGVGLGIPLPRGSVWPIIGW
jgi:hypothetical protein